ncbi:MAG: nuclear transport factor 2 family protein [Bacteroidetes bacterium]|nr:nuclear transport factor 2 family protein [Bacteroidota bacterium]
MRILIFSILLSMTINAQSNVETIQKEINNTVWKPFQKAFETLDADALNAIYADNVIRVTPQGIDIKNDFKIQNVKRFKDSEKIGAIIILDFWFDKRDTNETTSYEVGFYRIASTINGETSYSYGQFHIVLKKINGNWKITQDWDTATINGHTLGKTDFEKQQPIEF